MQGAVGTLGGQEKGERGPGEMGPAEASHQGSVHLRLRGRPRPSRALFGLYSVCFSVSLSIDIMNCSAYRNQDLEQSRILAHLSDGKLWQHEPPSAPGRPQLERSDSCPVPGPRKAHRPQSPPLPAASHQPPSAPWPWPGHCGHVSLWCSLGAVQSHAARGRSCRPEWGLGGEDGCREPRLLWSPPPPAAPAPSAIKS